MRKELDVVVLHNEGCPATPMTVESIRACASELGISIDLRQVLVESRRDAEVLRFQGSPTVLVEGQDIDPSARDSKVFGFM